MTDRGKYSVDDVDFFLLSEHATHLKKRSYNKAFDRAAEVTCLVSIWLPIVQAKPKRSIFPSNRYTSVTVVLTL